LLCLIVVIELPRQIADEKQEKTHRSNDPNGPLTGQNGLHATGVNHKSRLSQVKQKVTKETKIFDSA
jgi:hypothetical protein